MPPKKDSISKKDALASLAKSNLLIAQQLRDVSSSHERDVRYAEYESGSDDEQDLRRGLASSFNTAASAPIGSRAESTPPAPPPSRAPSASQARAVGPTGRLSAIAEDGEVSTDLSLPAASRHERRPSGQKATPAQREPSASRAKSLDPGKSGKQHKSTQKVTSHAITGYIPPARQTSPSTGTSMGWTSNKEGIESDFVLQHEGAAGGGPARIIVKPVGNATVADSKSESLNPSEMKTKFKERALRINERALLYFADAANEYAGYNVLFRGSIVTYPRSEGEIQIFYSRSSLMNILILAKKLAEIGSLDLPGSWRGDWDAKEWLRENINEIWDNINFCQHFTSHGLPDLHTYVIGKNLDNNQRASSDFLPISDTAAMELATNMERIKKELSLLNKTLSKSYKSVHPEEKPLFDLNKMTKISADTENFVNSVLKTAGSRQYPEGVIETQVYGYVSTFIATTVITAVLSVIPLAVIAHSDEVKRAVIMKILSNPLFLQTLGTTFAIGCSESIAIFIGEVVERVAFVLKIADDQIIIIKENITEAVHSLFGNKSKPAAGGKSADTKMKEAFDELSEKWATSEDTSLFERGASVSAEENWDRLNDEGAGEMRDASVDAIYNILNAFDERDDSAVDMADRTLPNNRKRMGEDAKREKKKGKAQGREPSQDLEEDLAHPNFGRGGKKKATRKLKRKRHSTKKKR